MAYTGFTPDDIISTLQTRYFYGLRLTDNGDLFFGRVDQLNTQDSLTINNPGPTEDNFTGFEEGQDFFEGRNIFGNTLYGNLNYEQYRWDTKDAYYYINEEGELVLRTNAAVTYDNTVSPDK